LAKRFYQIAYELDVPPRTLIAELATVNVSVGNQMVIVQPAMEERIRGIWTDLAKGSLPASEPVAETAVAVAQSPDAEEVEAPPVEEEIEAIPEETEAPPAPAVAAELVEPYVAEAPPAPAVAATAPAAATPAAPPPTAARPPGAPPAAVRPPPSGKLIQAKPRSQAELVPTIDPRAGRLLREAPRTPPPGVGTRGGARPAAPGAPGRVGDLNPTLAKQAPAPGVRRDSRTGRGDGDAARGGERHGKQTFQLRSRKRAAAKPDVPVDTTPKSFELTPPISVKQFSEVVGLKVSDIVKTMLLKHKQVVTPNSMLDEDTLVLLGVEFDRDLRFVKQVTSEDTMVKEAQAESKPENLVSRPPVVVVMGHVDHGKTSLLDWVRKADVAAHEAGGITQHIGAYQVQLASGKRITFFDTPGHEAFTEMRRRGAKVTDIVVLVVAADDGVMPQTVEAIEHAKAAEVPIVVAITKADKVGFQQAPIDKVKQQLTQHGILVSGWGGEVECFPVCSTGPQAGKGIDKMLEHLVLLAEVEDLKADPTKNATGTVVEAENNPGRGVLATLLVEQGTLRRGDALVAGRVWGRVRAMRDDKGTAVDEAPPGTPVEVTGLEDVPEVGKPFFVRPDANEAREIADQRRGREREIELAAQAKPASIEGLFSQIEQGKVKALKVILKTDVQGSLEAIKARLDALGNDEVKVQAIRAGVGAVSESDVTMAATYGALVLGFHVVADETARSKAKHLGVEIRMYRIIYELEEAVRAILEGKLAPESRETILGHAEILQVFRSTKLGNIAGCRVRDGLIRRDAQVRLARNGVVVWEGRIGSLRREKDDAREVKEGFECGIRLEGYDDIKDGDVIEAFAVEQVARTLAS
jgi:translation initiation factor IF-2